MKSRQRLWSRLILVSFILRALVPMGLMLQLPNAVADDDLAGSSSPFGYVICPLQNPAIDLSILVDKRQPHQHHVQHQALVNDSPLKLDQHSDSVISVDHGSFCKLWSSSAETSDPRKLDSHPALDSEQFSKASDKTIAFSQSSYPRQLPRAPPTTLR